MDDSSAPTPIPRAALAAIKTIAFLGSFAAFGFSLYGSNNELQLPLIHRANDPGIYPGDPFVATLPNYASALWHALWLPFRFLPEIPLLLILIGIQRWICLHCAGRLARALSGGNALAEAATWCVFAFGMKPFLGWGTVLPDYFEHTSLAVAAFLLGLAYLVEERPHRAGICFGLMALANIMHATHAALLLVPILIAARPLRTGKTLRGLALALPLATPAIVLALRALNQPAIPDHVFTRLLRFYVPAHFFPGSWGRTEWIVAGLGAAATAVAFGMRALPPVARDILVGASVGHALALVGATLAEVFGKAVWLNLQLARSSDLWTPLAAVFTLATIGAKQTLLPYRFRRHVWISASFLAVLFIWTWREPWAWMALLAVPGWVLAWGIGRVRAPSLTYLAPVVAVLWPLCVLSGYRLLAPASPFRGPLGNRPAPEIELGRWAQSNTPADARFLVDPSWSGFRLLSHRQSFVTWKDGAAILWQPSYAADYVQRLFALGVDPRDPRLTYPSSLAFAKQAFDHLDDSRAGRIASQFSVRYWIVPARKESDFPVAHRTSVAKVLVIGGGK